MTDSLTIQRIVETGKEPYTYNAEGIVRKHHDPTWLRPSRVASRIVSISYEEAHHRLNKVYPVKHQGGPVMLQQQIPEAINLINHFNADEIKITCNNGAIITISVGGAVTL